MLLLNSGILKIKCLRVLSAEGFFSAGKEKRMSQ